MKKKIEKLVKDVKVPEEDQVGITHVLWILAIIYKKHEDFQPILDPELLDATCNMDTYFKQIRPEMLQLYLFLKGDKRKKDRTITLNNNQQEITINKGIERWFTNLLDSYLHIYLGVDSVEEAEKELKEVYSTKKGRKASNPTQDLVMVGMYRLLVNHSGMKKKSDVFNFIHNYMVAIGLIISGDIDVNYINAKIAYLDKHGYACTGRYGYGKYHSPHRWQPGGPQAPGGSGFCSRGQRHGGLLTGWQPHREGEGVPGGHQRRNGKKNYDIRRKHYENTEGC